MSPADETGRPRRGRRPGNEKQIEALLYEALETEIGGLAIYETALSCAVNESLKQEWREYLEETRTHRRVLLTVFEQLGMETERETPGREVARHISQALLRAMRMAQTAGNEEAAQRVAVECVVLAETKDHANWALIGRVAQEHGGRMGRVLAQAHAAVAPDEDHHLYHSQGWARELWIEALGYPAVLPPPEEIRQAHTAIGAARARQQRGEMLHH